LVASGQPIFAVRRARQILPSDWQVAQTLPVAAKITTPGQATLPGDAIRSRSAR